MRNGLLDLLKLLGAFLIVCAHMPPSNPVSRMIANVCPMAMLPFFLTSGYYFLSGDGRVDAAKTRARVKKLLWITLKWFAFYLVVSTVLAALGNGRFNNILSLRAWIGHLTSPKTWLGLLAFQYVPGIGYQLWFMFALAWCNLVALAGEKLKLRRLLYALILPVCLGHIALQEASNQLGLGLHAMVISNAWTTGVPLFMLGMWIREHEERLRRLPLGLLVAAVIVGMAEPMISWTIYEGGRYYIGNYLAGTALFLLALRLGGRVPVSRWTKWAGAASTTVYLTHTLFIELMKMGLQLVPSLQPMDWLVAPIAFALSLGAHELLRRLPKRA